MSIYSLEIKLHTQPEAFERMLRVIRHRGFNIENLNLHKKQNASTNIYLTVKGEREISFLTSQLNKLIDIVDCQLLTDKQFASYLD